MFAGTSEGQVLSCDVSEFVTDGDHDYKQTLESCKDERWTEIIRGMYRKTPKYFGHPKNCCNYPKM